MKTIKLYHPDKDIVKRIQNRLTFLGIYKGELDGIYGPKTETAVKVFQIGERLVPDGVVGAITYKSLFGEPVTDILSIIKKENENYKLPLDIITAISNIESRGEGLIRDNTPVVLYERHQMVKAMSRRGLYKLIDLCLNGEPDLVNSSSGGYAPTREKEYERFCLAKAIHTECAIEATSFGIFQIMGFHWGKLGFSSPLEFEKYMGSLEGQVDCFFRFIETNRKLRKAILAKDLERIAYYYNGPLHEKNNYVGKLKKELNHE